MCANPQTGRQRSMYKSLAPRSVSSVSSVRMPSYLAAYGVYAVFGESVSKTEDYRNIELDFAEGEFL